MTKIATSTTVTQNAFLRELITRTFIVGLT